MMETVDGEYQNCKAFGGEYTRKHFFDKYPETAAMVAHLSDNDIWRLNRGGHDPHKIYAAYHRAVNTQGMPTVILAKTVKGYGMGTAGESLNPTHQTKSWTTTQSNTSVTDSTSQSATNNWTQRIKFRSTTLARIRRK